MRKWLKTCGAVSTEAGILISFLALGIVASSPQMRHGVNRAICSMVGGMSAVKFKSTGALSKFTINGYGTASDVCQTVALQGNGNTLWGTTNYVNRFFW
ncbi:MAG: hypothetical protein K1X79_10595 [Oligoflexia bacterium]|nr:hypothetical protein [Oligoflexia bacterium]